MIENPFESGHIRNYILAYVSIVIIMVLFFIASTLFHDIENIEAKVFDTNILQIDDVNISTNIVVKKDVLFKLMPRINDY